jgi:three-Cys-motif partner protein
MPENRGWSYWTRNKLQILADYAKTFNVAASGKASERIYIDLMAGQPRNYDRDTKEWFDGSARLALSATPGFTRFAFGEMPENAALLEADLREHFPDRDFRVYPGDCNVTIGQMLADLEPVRWAPTFAFLDQQAAELHWSTIQALAEFRRSKAGLKAEQWILWSPTMLYRGITTGNPSAYMSRIDLMYGDGAWRRIFRARRSEQFTPAQWRAEMTNFLRVKLERDLGYKHTFRIPMKMPNNVEIYEMVFATDHEAGARIMSHLYGQAAAREPGMIAEAQALRNPTEALASLLDDLDWEPSPAAPPKLPTWRSEPTWDPVETEWWKRPDEHPL